MDVSVCPYSVFVSKDVAFIDYAALSFLSLSA